MSSSPVRLPPSSRDFEIYRLVTVKEVSQREAARQMQLSPTRIRQIVDKVHGFVSQTSLLSTDLPREQQLRVAEVIASERVNLLFGESLRSWERSQGELTSTRRVSREGQPATLIETTHTSQGKTQYLNAALRYALAAAKLPPAVLNTMGVDKEQEEACAALADIATEEPPKEDAPSNGDCAVNERETGVTTQLSREPRRLSHVPQTGYAFPQPSAEVRSESKLPPAQRRSRQRFLAALHDPAAA